MQMWGVFVYAYDVTRCNFCTLSIDKMFCN